MSNRIKKAAVVMAALLMLWSLTACAQAQTSPEAQRITMATVPSGEAMPSVPASQPPEAETVPSGTVEDGFFVFSFEDAALQPGQAFDPSVLPAPTYTYTVPSCALEGTDNVYSYGNPEITAFNDGTGEFIYSVYLLDDSLSTPEGVKIGHTQAQVIALYGNAFQDNGGEYLYTRGDVVLSLLFQDGTVTAIEYLLGTVNV